MVVIVRQDRAFDTSFLKFSWLQWTFRVAIFWAQPERSRLQAGCFRVRRRLYP
ncbi:hypothetical protein KKY_2871 [Pelagibacterium halotolerans B2]|uniref:Uncharacterized protein n=1 Tax=Pelagibacterium halotolerans (strain DSM 22347 / JCM 15775 / CGMCC 1.7692 / B2) TaxID=1082931 RepID=G4RED1_PELHB|nr:hypothetical protein KKY_2871 [Pelagibacterium halotolerans B2]